jgi:ATP-dependent Clp protease ATP-binding subunit ClpB
LVDFKNAIIIMTSNIGSDLILEAKKMDDVRPKIDLLLKTSFKPEFLNRIDETIMFERLGPEQIRKIVDIQVARLEKRLAERKYFLEVNDGAKDYLAENGYDPQFGARPLIRTIRAEVENPLARRLLAGDFKEGDSILAKKGKEGLEFVSKG